MEQMKGSYPSFDPSDLSPLLNSAESLDVLEILPDRRSRIWNNFQANLRRKHIHPNYDLFVTVKDDIIYRIQDDCGGDEDEADWIALFTATGLASTFIERVMHPDFADMRRMSTAKEILRMYICDRWEFLEGNDDQSPASELPASEPPAAMPDHKMLYVGGTLARLKDVLNPDGRPNFNKIRLHREGDFHPSRCGVYFTTQYSVAIRYAQWIAQVLDKDVIPVGVLQVAMPESLLRSSYELVGAEWQSFVYFVRKRISSRYTEFAYLRGYRWLIGAICCQSQRDFNKNRITKEEDVKAWRLAHTNEVATQYFVKEESAISSIFFECGGKVWISPLNTSS